MAMSLCGARLAVLPRIVPAIRPSIAQRVIRPGVVQPACPSASRPINLVPERTVRTQAASNQQPETPPPVPALWLANYGSAVATLLGIFVSALALYMSLRGVITDSITVLSREQAASNRELAASISENKSELAASIREQAASISENKSEQAASNRVLSTKLDATTASIKELKSEVNTKLDNFSATVQAQQIETAKLQGLVSGLQEGGKKK